MAMHSVNHSIYIQLLIGFAIVQVLTKAASVVSVSVEWAVFLQPDLV